MAYLHSMNFLKESYIEQIYALSYIEQIYALRTCNFPT